MDHLNQIPGVGPPENWMLEGNATLAALAGRTERAQLGLMVGGVTYRNPALLAKTTTTIDVLSGGRAVLGIGAAWFEAEHQAFGYDFPPLRERFERLEDALRISSRDVHDRPADRERHPPPDRGPAQPAAPDPGDIPIMIGGSGERKTLRLVAEYADASQHLRRPRARAAPARGARAPLRGRQPGSERDHQDQARHARDRTDARAGAQAKLEPIRERVPAERVAAMVLAGDPDGVGEQVAAFLDAGLDGLIVNMPDVHDLESVALAGRGPLEGDPAQVVRPLSERRGRSRRGRCATRA